MSANLYQAGAVNRHYTNRLSKGEFGKWVAAVCLGFLALQIHAAQFAEISAEIEVFGYRLGDTNSIAKAKPQTVNVVCITDSNQWYMTNDVQQPEQWLFDGTNVWCRTQTPSLKEQVVNKNWESRDGHPMDTAA
jgi:hypothetical protein